MLDADLYIIAAGNASRMNIDVPKALLPITDKPCLTTTLQQIGHKFRRAFVVTNVLARDQWKRYFHELDQLYPELARLVVDLPIRSGLGDGHATLQGLLAAERIDGMTSTGEVVITWGDVFFVFGETIDELPSIPAHASGILPVINERNPYVTLLTDERMQCICADLSKNGERHAIGFHDQSVFRFIRSKLKSALAELHNSLWKGSRYISAHGELPLLYALHHLYNSGSPVHAYESQYPTRSFNTIEEVVALQREISRRWERRFRLECPPEIQLEQRNDSTEYVGPTL